MDDLLTTGALALGRGIGAGRIDPVVLAEAYLDAIETHPHGTRIYARTTRDRALAEARAAKSRAGAGTRRGPLDGVPISWKDLFDTAGVATESGSALLKGRTPDRDALVVARATAHGLVCLGKTHLSELAFSGLGLNPVTATPPNVHDPDAVAGGSSSGAAASVAHGLAPAAIGSDTAGSVRIPAAWNDLVGLKTTHGRLPLDGTVPLAASLDTVGPLTRSVADAAALFAVMGGRDADLGAPSLSGVRVAVCRTVAFDGIEDAPAAGFETGRRALEAAGASVTDRDLPSAAAALDLAAPIFGAETWGTWSKVIEAAPDRMFPQILDRFRGGQDVPGHVYVAALNALAMLRRDWAAATADVDAVILPTCPILPPKIAELTGDRYVERNLMALRNTRIGSLLGLSALTLPTDTPSAGIMLMGRGGDDERLLRLGAALEMSLGTASA